MLEAGKRTRNLGDYLKIFDLTLSVMQEEEALYRVAYELAGGRRDGERAPSRGALLADPPPQAPAVVPADRRSGDRGAGGCRDASTG